MSSPAIRHDGRHASGRVAFNLATLTLIAASAAIGLAYLVDGLEGRSQRLASLLEQGPEVEKSIAGQQLLIPDSWFRFEDQKQLAFADRIDLKVAAPLGAGGNEVGLDFSLIPRSRARASERLLDNVYLHQFQAGQIDGPVGLIGKPLVGQEGFQNETVWYDPISTHPFVAKCMAAPVASDAAPTGPDICLRTVILTDKVAIVYSFEEPLLLEWRTFDDALRPLLRKIGAL